MPKTLKIWLISAAFLTPLKAYADYCATGPIKGNVCSGFVIETCRYVEIEAIRVDGTLYHPKRCYESVSDYRSSNDQRCWIRTKSTEWGIISWGINTAFQPEFLSRSNDGTWEELDVEYLTFPCVKR